MLYVAASCWIAFIAFARLYLGMHTVSIICAAHIMFSSFQNEVLRRVMEASNACNQQILVVDLP